MKIGQNCPKVKSCLPDKLFNQKGREVSKMIKNHNFEEKICDSWWFWWETIRKWAKSDLKLADDSWTKGLPHENNRTIENYFSSKDVSDNFTKSYQFSAASANYSRSSRWKTRGGPKSPPPPRNIELKGTSSRKKVKLKWKSVKNAKRRAITDLNAPNGSRDTLFQIQEFEQYGRHHFLDF